MFFACHVRERVGQRGLSRARWSIEQKTRRGNVPFWVHGRLDDFFHSLSRRVNAVNILELNRVWSLEASKNIFDFFLLDLWHDAFKAWVVRHDKIGRGTPCRRR